MGLTRRLGEPHMRHMRSDILKINKYRLQLAVIGLGGMIRKPVIKDVSDA